MWAYRDILVALTIATVVAIVPGLGAAYLARQLADIPSNNPMIGSADTVGESLAGTVMLAMLCAYPFLLAPIAAALLPVALAIVQGQRRWWRHVWRTRHTIRPTVAPLVLIILIWVSFISIHVLLLWFIISPRVLDEDRINSMALGLVHLSIGVVLPLASELGRMVHATTE